MAVSEIAVAAVAALVVLMAAVVLVLSIPAREPRSSPAEGRRGTHRAP
jgi:hypothetical protein